jgi:rhodanese-related sulfurtransferase
MRWKQFFTPVESISPEQGKKLIADRGIESLTILDVRQPNEYSKSHIPGAKLIPLPELGNRLAELNAGKTTLVY